LGIKEGSTVALVAAPDGFSLEQLPDGVDVRTRAGAADVVLFFTKSRAEFARRIAALGQNVYPAGALWIAWPKKASKVETDMTENVVREIALPLGLVDTKVCAVDDTWSGLKLVWRLTHR
jgi:hypothetical protein